MDADGELKRSTCVKIDKHAPRGVSVDILNETECVDVTAVQDPDLLTSLFAGQQYSRPSQKVDTHAGIPPVRLRSTDKTHSESEIGTSTLSSAIETTHVSSENTQNSTTTTSSAPTKYFQTSSDPHTTQKSTLTSEEGESTTSAVSSQKTTQMSGDVETSSSVLPDDDGLQVNSTNSINIRPSSGHPKTTSDYTTQESTQAWTQAETTNHASPSPQRDTDSSGTTVSNPSLKPSAATRITSLPRRTSTPVTEDWVSCGVAPRVRRKRVVKGQDVTKGEVPWMAMVLTHGTFQCGGSVLDSTHILTAAHCVTSEIYSFWSTMSPYDMKVIVGKHSKEVTDSWLADPAEQRISVAKVIPHPRYDRDSLEGDLAILVLRTKLVLTDWVRPICLPGPHDILPSEASVAGWGSVEPRFSSSYDLVPPKVLQKTRLSVYGSQLCRTKFANTRANGLTPITDGMICSLDPNPPSSSALYQVTHSSNDCK
ncbi:hypothetical protein BaRGS_00026740, partial [Batillaria attramentaria]